MKTNRIGDNPPSPLSGLASTPENSHLTELVERLEQAISRQNELNAPMTRRDWQTLAIVLICLIVVFVISGVLSHYLGL